MPFIFTDRRHRAGCGQSDIDLLAVIGKPMTVVQRRDLISALLRISGRHPSAPEGPRCVEIIVFLRPEIIAASFPPQAEFMYGEWLRGVFEAGEMSMPVRDPENTIILAQARQKSLPLTGLSASQLLPKVFPQQIDRAMRDLLPALLSRLRGDERNVLLTLARMWRTAKTGEFVPKDVAAAWAIPQMPGPEAASLNDARRAYLGEIGDDWASRRDDARRVAEHLSERVMELL